MFQSDSPGLLIDKDNVFAVFLHDVLVRKFGLEPVALRFNIDTHRLQYTNDGADYAFLLTRIDEDIEILAEAGGKTFTEKWSLNEVISNKMILTDASDLEGRLKAWIS